jgi:hypothetical protein
MACVGEGGPIVSVHLHERGRQPGAAPVVVPAPPGRSRLALPPPLGRVAGPAARAPKPAPPVPACSTHRSTPRVRQVPRHHPQRRTPLRPRPGVSGRGSCAATPGTSWPGQRASGARLVRDIACLAAGWGRRGPARGDAIAPPTVLSWWGEATEQQHTFSSYCLPEFHLPKKVAKSQPQKNPRNRRHLCAGTNQWC